MKRISLKSVNERIQAKYPLLVLVKGKGYYWVHSDDDNSATQLSRLYTTSIDIPRITLLTPDQWLDKVEWVLADSCRYEYDRMPVVFPINQPDYTCYTCEVTPAGIRINEGWVDKSDATARLKEQKAEGHTDGLTFRVYSGKFLKSKGVDPGVDANWSAPSYMDQDEVRRSSTYYDRERSLW